MTKKTVEPAMSLEEIRKELDGKEKPVYVQLSTGSGIKNLGYNSASIIVPEFLKNKTPDEIAAYLNDKAAEAGLTGPVEVRYRAIPVTKTREVYKGGGYKHVPGRGRIWVDGEYVSKVTTQNEGPYWVLVGYEPYSDEELLKIGKKLIEQKRKKEAAELKKLQDKVDAYNRSAAELGIPTITIDDIKEGK